MADYLPNLTRILFECTDTFGGSRETNVLFLKGRELLKHQHRRSIRGIPTACDLWGNEQAVSTFRNSYNYPYASTEVVKLDL